MSAFSLFPPRLGIEAHERIEMWLFPRKRGPSKPKAILFGVLNRKSIRPYVGSLESLQKRGFWACQVIKHDHVHGGPRSNNYQQRQKPQGPSWRYGGGVGIQKPLEKPAPVPAISLGSLFGVHITMRNY